MTIRPATLNDQALVTQAMLKLFESQPGSVVAPTQDNSVWYWTMFLMPAIRDGLSAIFLAMQEEQLVGAIIWCKCDGPLAVRYSSGFGWGIWVDEAYRRQGVGRALVESSKAALTSLGVTSLVDTCPLSNPGVLDFLHKVGFVPDSMVLKLTI